MLKYEQLREDQLEQPYRDHPRLVVAEQQGKGFRVAAARARQPVDQDLLEQLAVQVATAVPRPRVLEGPHQPLQARWPLPRKLPAPLQEPPFRHLKVQELDTLTE